MYLNINGYFTICNDQHTLNGMKNVALAFLGKT